MKHLLISLRSTSQLRWFLAALLTSSVGFAQTPDWRPINRVYKLDGQTVGSVGSAGQIKAGHVLTAKSFPAAIATDSAKLAYWNLSADANDELATHNLTNNGTVPFTGTNIFGVSGAATLNGSTQSLSSTNSYFNPGSGVSFAYGGWFYTTNWAQANVSLIGGAGAASDRGFVLYMAPGGLTVYATNTAANWDVSFSLGTPTSGWHHIAVVYDYGNTVLKGYVDGKQTASTVMANQRPVSSPIFRIGASDTSATGFFTGSAEDVFFINCGAATLCVTNADVLKFYSTRIDHNKNLIAKRQDWQIRHQHLGVAGNPYQKLPFVWMDTTDKDSIFADFSDLDASDKLDIRLFDLQQ